MEIHIQKTEKIRLNRDQQKEIALKVINQAKERFVSNVLQNEDNDGNELRYRRLTNNEKVLWVAQVDTNLHHGGEDISWKREATQHENDVYNMFSGVMKEVINLD